MEIKKYGDLSNSLVVVANDNNRWVDAFGDVTKFVLENSTPTDDTTGDPTRFVMTVTEAGAGDTTCINSVTAEEKLTITTAANEYDGINLQAKGSQFNVNSSKPFQMYCKLKVSDATQSDLLVGLASVDTSLLATGSAHAVSLTGDGLFFLKLDATTTVSAEVYLDNSETGTADYATALGTSEVEFLIHYNGQVVNFYIDGSLVGGFTGSLPDSVLTPSINFRAGAAAAKTLTIYDFSVIQLNS